jgi:hypothetical protein
METFSDFTTYPSDTNLLPIRIQESYRHLRSFQTLNEEASISNQLLIT